MRRLFALLVACLIPASLLAQAPAPAPAKPGQSKPAPAQPPKTAEPAKPGEPPKTAVVITPGLAESGAPPEITQLVQTWLEAWNKLDGSAGATQKFLDLYAPDARHEVGVSGRPLGPEFFAAPNGLRKMAEDFARLNSDAAYRLETFTAAEKAVDIIYSTDGPWGGPALAVPYTGAYTVKDSKRRFFYPGVAVFHVKAGKITYARFYQDRDNISEVRP